MFIIVFSHRHISLFPTKFTVTSEMESAAIFSVALARRKRAGAVFTALWNVERSNAGLPDTVCMDSDRAIRTAVNAVKILIEQDRKNGI